jgi:hypothetical protein
MAETAHKATASSPTRKQVRHLIDEAELSYRKVWSTLVSMKTGVGLDGNAILAFQPTLASALFRLDDGYRKLIQSQKADIRRKASIPEQRFRQRMRAIAEDLKALRSTMKIGRDIGDAFAWAFLREDQKLIEKHFSHPPNPHTPPGIGGRGELEFVRQFGPAGFLMLYHGATSFLRIGDVSFVDLKSGRVTAIGELKSKPDGPGKLKATLVILSSDREKVPFGIVVPEPKPNEKEDGSLIDPFFEETLKRQSKEIATALRQRETRNKTDLRDAYHIDELAQFAIQLSTKRLAFQQIGRGMVLAGCCPYRGRTLSSRIYSATKEGSVLKRMAKIKENVAVILDPSLTDNGIIFSELDSSIRVGQPPLFWFPCDIDFLEKIYFMRAITATVLNPAHLLKRLRDHGYEVHTDQQGRNPPVFTVSKRSANTLAGIEQFDFFLRLMQQRFMREEKIMEIFESCLSQMQKMSSTQSIRMQMGFAHFL